MNYSFAGVLLEIGFLDKHGRQITTRKVDRFKVKYMYSGSN